MTDRERVEEIRETIRKNRDRNDWMHRGPCSMRDALDLLAHVDALTDEVERLRQERRDVTQWRDQTLAAENERLRKTLVVAYDREAESDDENAAKIAELEATNTRLREALGPMVRVREIQRSAWKNDWDRLEATFRPGLSPFTKAELDAAAQAVEDMTTTAIEAAAKALSAEYLNAFHDFYGGNPDKWMSEDEFWQRVATAAIEAWVETRVNALTIDEIDSILDASAIGPMRFARGLFRQALKATLKEEER